MTGESQRHSGSQYRDHETRLPNSTPARCPDMEPVDVVVRLPDANRDRTPEPASLSQTMRRETLSSNRVLHQMAMEEPSCEHLHSV